MAVARPRVWVSQPLFDDIVDQLAAHCDVDAVATVTEHAPADVAAALRDADGALVTLNERIGAAELATAATRSRRIIDDPFEELQAGAWRSGRKGTVTRSGIRRR